jgi:peptide/nickel transport system permease protein
MESLASAAQPRRGLFNRITPQSRFYWVRLLKENPSAVAAFLFIVTVVIASIVVPAVSAYDPFRYYPQDRLMSPNSDHWLGTNSLGQDILLLATYGARTSLLVGMAVMIISGFLGSVFGLISGYYSRLDTPIMRIMDGIMAFPSILLAIAIMASLGPATENVIVALGVVYMPVISRLVRGQTLSLKNFAFVEAARSIGQSNFKILSTHIYPNTLSPLIVQCTFVVAYAIIAEASLSFLGAGVPPDVPTWGNMLRDGQQVLTIAWWVAVIPGILLFLTVLAMNLLGDGLRDALDARSRTR